MKALSRLDARSVGARVAAAGAHVVANPAHLALDAAQALTRLGAQRAGAGRTYAFKTLIQARRPRRADPRLLR